MFPSPIITFTCTKFADSDRLRLCEFDFLFFLLVGSYKHFIMICTDECFQTDRRRPQRRPETNREQSRCLANDGCTLSVVDHVSIPPRLDVLEKICPHMNHVNILSNERSTSITSIGCRGGAERGVRWSFLLPLLKCLARVLYSVEGC